MRKAVTIKEIAEALNLSRNTVSKALNGQPVPNKTRELVYKKAQEMGYKTFSVGSSLSKSYRILLLSGKPFHNIDFFLPLTGAIETYCYQNNYEFFQFTCGKGTTAFEKVADNIKKSNIDGIVAIECFETAFIENLLSLDIPICFIDFTARNFKAKQNYDLICSSDQKSVYNLVANLINDKGFSKFSFVGDHRHCLSFHERYLGMLRGLRAYGLSHLDQEDILDDDGFEYGKPTELKKKIEKYNRLPDCFICCNDFVARNMIISLKKMGFTVPLDTTVVGYDGVNAALEESPTITTFQVDQEFLGQEAIRILLSRIEYKNLPSRTIIVESKLVIGESTK